MNMLIKIFVLILPMQVFAQETVKIGQVKAGEVSPGTPIIQIGFNRTDFINVHTIRPARYLYLTWGTKKVNERATGFLLQKGVIKSDYDFNWEEPVDIGKVNHYVLKVSYFDHVIRIFAYDNEGIFKRSQIRLIHQKLPKYKPKRVR